MTDQEHRDDVISVDGMTVRYGWRGRPVLDAIDLSLAAGEVRVVLGRNGEGKSSLVRCLLGHQKPSRGRPRLFGDDVWRRRARLMQRVGVVPEEPDAPPSMTPGALSRFSARIYERWDGEAYIARLERCGIPLDRPFGKLSKGQKGQVHLALALAHSPDLLVLDDPTLGFDAVARRSLFEELIGELAERGVTVFLTTHDLAGVETLATRVSLLSGGRFRLDEDLEELRARVRRLDFTLPESSAQRASEVRELLEPWAPVRADRLGRRWSVTVERWDDAAMARLREVGAEGEVVATLGLEEIFLALVGPDAETVAPSDDSREEGAA